MSEETLRSVHVSRVEKAVFRATNQRGGVLQFGEGGTVGFTPVELLLIAIAGCTAIDVDYLTSKKSEPTRFAVSATADKVRDDDGNRLENIRISFDVAFPGDEAGQAMAARVPDAIKRSHDRLCTVSRTVELGTAVDSVQVDPASQW